MTEADDLRADQLERVARLRARREQTESDPSRRRPPKRRRHPAQGGRIAAAGLGATTMLGIIGAFGLGSRMTNADTPPPEAPPSEVPVPAAGQAVVAPPIEVVIHRMPATATPAATPSESTPPIELTATPVVQTVTVTRPSPAPTPRPAPAPTATTSGSS